MERFQSSGCINCHGGPMFSDFAGNVLGGPDNHTLTESDAGGTARMLQNANTKKFKCHGALHARRPIRNAAADG